MCVIISLFVKENYAQYKVKFSELAQADLMRKLAADYKLKSTIGGGVGVLTPFSANGDSPDQSPSNL